MFKNKIEKVLFVIVMIAVLMFCWFKPEKHSVNEIPEWDMPAEYYYNGKNGSYCDGPMCYLAVHADDGWVADYYKVERDLVTKGDLEMYYYLAPYGTTIDDLYDQGFNDNVYYEPIYNRSHRYVICD